MLKRDSLTAQMQQLSHVLAKVKRLILEDHEAEALKVVRDVLSDFFGFDEDKLFNSTEEEFRTTVAGLKGEELSMLASFVDEHAGLQEELDRQLLLYRRYLLLVGLMESEFGFISMDHLNRKQILQEQMSRF